MKLLLWVSLGLAVTGLAFWMVTTSGIPRNPFIVFLFVAVYAVAPVGAFWMLYVAIRNERRPLPIILLAFVPYAFFWYYFERVRTGKHRTRAMTTA
jgi:hypothetical protein